MSKYSFKYKLRSGDNYKNLSQRFGTAILGNVGIYGDEDLKKDHEYTFKVNSKEEAETILKKDLEYQTQKNKNIARRKNEKLFDNWWNQNGENFLVRYFKNEYSNPQSGEKIRQRLRESYIQGGGDINDIMEKYQLLEDAFWQGQEDLSDASLAANKETIKLNAAREQLARIKRNTARNTLETSINNIKNLDEQIKVEKDKLNKGLENNYTDLIKQRTSEYIALENANNELGENAQVYTNPGRFNRYHTGRVDYLRANGNKGIIGRGLTLNGNTDLSYQSSMENLLDQLKLGQDLKDYAKTGAGVAVGLASLPALSPLSSVLTSTPVNLGLGAYGIYDSTTDMYNNGINLSNSIQLAGSILPYMRYTKIGNYINNWGKSTKLGLYFDPQKVKETSDALAATQKINPVTASTRSLLLFRRNFPKILKGTANLVLDMSAGTSGSNLAQKVNKNIDKIWDYNYDKNGDVIKDINYYAKLGTQSALNTLGFTFGLGARNGNSFRNLVTSSLAYGPGTDLMYKGLDSVENKYNLKDNWFWDKGSGLVKLTAPVLLQRGLDRSISFGKQKLGSQLNLQDLMALNTTSKDAIIDNLVEEGVGLPIAYAANSVLPDDIKDEATVLQLASMIGSRINPKHRLAQALESTAGALKYDHKTVMRTLESMLAGDLTRYRYTGTYENNDSYMLGSTLQGSIYGVEGAGKNKKGKGSFNKYDQSLGRNFAQRRDEALPISWWNLFSGSYVPKVGESFNADSKIVRFDSDYKNRNDFASKMAAEDGNSRRMVEIKNDSKILGNNDVPLGLTSGLVFGVPRSDGYFTGNNGTALNTVGANGVIYKDASGNLKGVLVVDYTNPGVRRVSPSNTWFGKGMHFLAHPIKSITHPQKWLRGDFSSGDNYYNKDSKGKLGDLAYLGTSLATSLTGALQRNKVFSTTGYKSFLNVTDSDFMGKIRNLLFDPENKKLKLPTATEIHAKYKGTELTDFGAKLEHFINELNNYEGSNLGEKYQNYNNLGNVGNKIENSKPKLKKTKSKKIKPIKDSPQIELRLKNEHIMENWFSAKKLNFYNRSKKGKLGINTHKLELLFTKNKNPEIKTEYFLTLPEDVQKYIKDNYQFTLYKRGGKLLPNIIGL